MEGDPLPLYAGIERTVVGAAPHHHFPDRLGELVAFVSGRWDVCCDSAREESRGSITGPHLYPASPMSTKGILRPGDIGKVIDSKKAIRTQR